MARGFYARAAWWYLRHGYLMTAALFTTFAIKGHADRA